MSEIINKSLQKVAKGTGIVFIGTIISMLLGFIGIVLITRYFTQSEYGTFSLALVLLNIFVLISSLGIQGGSPRYIAFFRGKKDTRKVQSVIYSSIKIVLIASILCSLFAFFTADTISSKVFHIPELATPLKIFAIAIPFLVLIDIFTSLFRGFGRADVKVYFQDILRSILFISFLAIVIFLNLSFCSLLYAYFASFAITFVVFVVYCVKKPPIPPKRGRNSDTNPIGKELLFFSLPLLFMNVLNMIWQWADTLMLGYFKTADIVGLYNVTLHISRFLSFFLSSVVFIYLPIATSLYSRNLIEELKRTYAVLTKWIFIAAFPVFLILFLFPEAVLNILFGPRYVPASTALQILAFGVFIGTITGPNGATLVTIGKTKLILMDSLASTITNIFLNVLLIPKFGIVGAAYASAVSVILMTLLVSLQIYQAHKIHPVTKNYVKPAMISLILVFIIYLFATNFIGVISIWMLLLLFVLFLLTYILSAIFTKSFDKEDLAMLLEIEKRIGVDLKGIKNILKRFV